MIGLLLPTLCSANVTVNTLHPGVVATELGRFLLPSEPQWWQLPLFNLLQGFALSPEEGSKTSVYLCSSPEVEGVTSKYFDKCRPVASSRESYDIEVARRLFEVSVELTGAPVPSLLQGQAARV